MIRPGQVFQQGDTKFQRLSNDPKPQHENFKFRVRVLCKPSLPGFTPYTFAVEAEWFRQRGLQVA